MHGEAHFYNASTAFSTEDMIKDSRIPTFKSATIIQKDKKKHSRWIYHHVSFTKSSMHFEYTRGWHRGPADHGKVIDNAGGSVIVREEKIIR